MLKTSPMNPVHTATPADEARVIDTLTLAFSADPATRWSWPNAQDYLSHFPRFARAFGGSAFSLGTAHATPGHAGAALWLPPGAQVDDALVDEVLRSALAGAHRDHVFAVLDQMGAYHPSEPHWYLPLIGVDPHHQGRGHGSALLAHALAACDRDQQLAYLEATNPRSLPLYERHGFEVLGRIQEGTSPTLFPMLRRPRTTTG